MSEELKSFKNLIFDLNISIDEVEEVKEGDLYTIYKALTPPTEQEVCEALSHYWEKPVYYEGGMFIMQKNKSKRSGKDSMIVQSFTTGLHFYFDIPAYLLEMLAKFYKGDE